MSLFILNKKKFNIIPYIGRKNTNPIKIFITVCVPQISNQFIAIYASTELKNAIKKKEYESIIFDTIVDNAGAIHQLENFSRMN